MHYKSITSGKNGEPLEHAPRTLIGTTPDDKLYIAVVDDRSRNSVGIDYHEACLLIKKLGCDKMFALDGGILILIVLVIVFHPRASWPALVSSHLVSMSDPPISAHSRRNKRSMTITIRITIRRKRRRRRRRTMGRQSSRQSRSLTPAPSHAAETPRSPTAPALRGRSRRRNGGSRDATGRARARLCAARGSASAR